MKYAPLIVETLIVDDLISFPNLVSKSDLVEEIMVTWFNVLP
jgi:hypothetical protein